jgi:hypothetical protein
MAQQKKKKGFLCFMIWFSVCFNNVHPAVTDPSIQEIQLKKLHGNKNFGFFINRIALFICTKNLLTK